MIGIFLDSETTGLDYLKHRVLEVAILFVDLNNHRTLAEYQRLIQVSENDWAASDPGSLKVHEISFTELESLGVTPERAATEICDHFGRLALNRRNSVFICQNPSFDRPFFSQIVSPTQQDALKWPYHWLDLASMFWAAQLIQGRKTPWDTGLSKDKIAKVLGLQPEPRPHRAMNGTAHLLECYKQLLPPAMITQNG